MRLKKELASSNQATFFVSYHVQDCIWLAGVVVCGKFGVICLKICGETRF